MIKIYQKINKFQKKADEKKIRSLFGINKGRKSMREALGMTMVDIFKDSKLREDIKKEFDKKKFHVKLIFF